MQTWLLRHPTTRVVWVVTHEDTAKRCLSEGYAPVPPSASAPEPVSAAPTPTPTPQMAAAASPKRRGRSPSS